MIFISNRNGSLEFVNRVQPSYTAPCENSIKVVPKYKRNTDVPGLVKELRYNSIVSFY